MSKIGIANMKISTDGINFTPICSTQEIELAMEETPEWWQDLDISKPVSISATIRAKKKGTLFEKCLYYRKSKKRRIRKKWSLKKVLGFRK